MERGLTLGLAESCTGGLIGHRLTNVPGSSEYFLGGIVAYSYEAKKSLLGVRPDTLISFGAVSEQTAREMAQGVRRALCADIGVAVTGIAGPGGATPDKPLGLTWIALCAPDFEQAEHYIWAGDRVSNKAQSAEAALRLIERYLRQERPRMQGPGDQGEASQMETTEVEARFSAEGEVSVLSFTWHGHKYPVTSQGRQWRAEDGWHYLVMTTGERVFELVYAGQPERGSWRIEKAPGRERLA